MPVGLVMGFRIQPRSPRPPSPCLPSPQAAAMPPSRHPFPPLAQTSTKSSYSSTGPSLLGHAWSCASPACSQVTMNMLYGTFATLGSQHKGLVQAQGSVRMVLLVNFTVKWNYIICKMELQYISFV